MWDCTLELELEEQAIYDQAPKTRILGLHSALPAYSLVIREDEPSPALDAAGLYRQWLRTGKIPSLRGGRFGNKIRESEPLIQAYQYGVQLGREGGGFRDALTDAFAEFLDDFGINNSIFF